MISEPGRWILQHPQPHCSLQGPTRVTAAAAARYDRLPHDDGRPPCPQGRATATRSGFPRLQRCGAPSDRARRLRYSPWQPLHRRPDRGLRADGCHGERSLARARAALRLAADRSRDSPHPLGEPTTQPVTLTLTRNP